jgi:hypothetical protein
MYTFENHPKNKGEIMETRRVAFIVLLVFFLGTGCQAGLVDPESAGDITSTPGMKREAVETPDRIDNMAKTPERVPLTESIPPVAGEVPTELLDTIFKDLEGRTGIERRDFNVIQAQFIVWNDGSLGCPAPRHSLHTGIGGRILGDPRSGRSQIRLPRIRIWLLLPLRRWFSTGLPSGHAGILIIDKISGVRADAAYFLVHRLFSQPVTTPSG